MYHTTIRQCVLAGGGGATGVEAGGVGGGVGGGNRTLIETFLACVIIDLTRVRIEPILASRKHESTALILV